ncbi:molybdopterin cofactor-binding domain-containing protein [Parerythrobacter aurantius]|uniref:molybdopterin cofactor-binding domain-containing protein n=1 Tax=Parerythrobacter aurantius TaxID=3127706 RepID=UPI003245FE7A
MVLVSRRGVLAGAAVGGGLLVAWSMWPRDYASGLAPTGEEADFDAWLKIAADGIVTVALPQLEMGQGVSTVLPQVVATELGADWRQVAVQPVAPSGAYANIPLAAKWGRLWLPSAVPGFVETGPDDLVVRRWAEAQRFCATAEGTSLAAYEAPCRAAAAAARAMLVQVAADRWDVAAEECDTARGFVVHGRKRLRFGELALDAAELDPPDPPPLRAEAPAERPGPGTQDAARSLPRLDLPSKVDGSHVFAGDVRLPGMVYAAIRHGPADRALLAGFDAAAGRAVPGYVGAVQGKRWLAAVAENWWAAERALAAMVPRFTAASRPDSEAIEGLLAEARDKGESYRIAQRGDGAEAMGKPDLTLHYDIRPAMHLPLETATATAWLRDGRLELWLASQAPEAARSAVAAALDLRTEDVILYPMPAGGSFDARLEHGHAIEAALIARETAGPVQLVWSRWQEMLASHPRAPVAAKVSARLAPDGSIAILRTRLAVQPWGREAGSRLFGNRTNWAAIEETEGEADPIVGEGAMPPYAIPHVVVDHVPVRTGLPAGRMRGQAHGYTAFVRESFIDEIALRNEREPLSYRIAMLGEDPRLVECLQRAARLAEWGGGSDGRGQGLACHRMDLGDSTGRIACIATAKQEAGGVRVTKFSVAVDIGRIVNVDIARQQIEGGLLFGTALALGSDMGWQGGLPTSARLAAMNMPVLGDCPEIEVEFLPGKGAPFDPGELGMAVAAPAIANALFSATGLRLRNLPLLSGGL